MKTTSSRVKRYPITPEILLFTFMKGVKLEVVAGIPVDAKFRGFTVDVVSNCINIFVEHPSFEECVPGFEAPIAENIQIRRLAYETE